MTIATQPHIQQQSMRRKWPFYGLIWLAANGLLWSIALIYSKTVNPDYVSKWSITLPSASTSTNISLPDIGNASSVIRSPYDNASTRDPRENYKFIFASESVINAAANSLGISPSEFGKPDVEIISNTTLMSFEITGDTPEEAKEKALALQEAFQNVLSQMRTQEIEQQNVGVQAALGSAEIKLKLAQSLLSNYQAESGLTSVVQIEQLSSNIEQLRRERAILIAQFEQADARLGELSTNLRVTAQQASEAFQLSSDSIFQQHLKNYSDAVAAISSLSDQLGPNHPMMVKEVARRDASQTAVVARSKELLGRSVDLATLSQLNISTAEGTTGRGELFQGTVIAQVDRQGLSAQVTALDQQIAQLENRLKLLAQYGSNLESLNRDVKIAEAVFSATLTRLDLSRSNLFGSYPQIQLVTEPTLPSGNKPLKAELALVGALFSSFLITTGLATLIIRDLKMQQYRLSQASSPKNESEILNGKDADYGDRNEAELISQTEKNGG